MHTDFTVTPTGICRMEIPDELIELAGHAVRLHRVTMAAPPAPPPGLFYVRDARLVEKQPEGAH